MTKRSGEWFWELMCALSQVLCVWLRGWRYVWRGDCEKPDSNLTTSAWIGTRAIQGYRIALIAEVFVDWLFFPGHCRAAAARSE